MSGSQDFSLPRPFSIYSKHASLWMTEQYTFVEIERQDQLTRAIQERLTERCSYDRVLRRRLTTPTQSSEPPLDSCMPSSIMSNAFGTILVPQQAPLRARNYQAFTEGERTHRRALARLGRCKRSAT